MKRVYLVRHGQTNANVNLVFQGPDEPLNDVGKQQAIRLAERVQALDYEKLIVSDYLRTRQTAEPILEVKSVPVEYSELLREERRPTSWWLEAKKELDEDGVNFHKDMVDRAGDVNWRIEDMENPTDVLERVKKTLEMLRSDVAENILVVSHGDFLRQLIAYVLLDCDAIAEETAKFRRTLKTTNTGISVIYHDDTRWRVLTWNDHAHFAE